MAYQYGNTFVFGEQPSASKMDQIWRNDDFLFDRNTVIQHQQSKTSGAQTGTTTIPNDNTVPQITEGNQFMTCSITPTDASNFLYFFINVNASYSTPSPLIAALFQVGNSNALACNAEYIDTSSAMASINIMYSQAAGSTSALTFSVRVGGSSAGTVTLNGQSGAQRFSTAYKSSIHIFEMKV